MRQEWFEGRLHGRVLEVGCGSGRVAEHLFRLNRERITELIAIDPNAEFIEHARRAQLESSTADFIEHALRAREGVVEYRVAVGSLKGVVEYRVGWLGEGVDAAENCMRRYFPKKGGGGGAEGERAPPTFDHVVLATTLSHIDPAAYPQVLAQCAALLRRPNGGDDPVGGVVHIFDNDLSIRRQKVGQICLYRRNFIGGFDGSLRNISDTP
jgi:SAM-dependent methyltransferase